MTVIMLGREVNMTVIYDGTLSTHDSHHDDGTLSTHDSHHDAMTLKYT